MERTVDDSLVPVVANSFFPKTYIVPLPLLFNRILVILPAVEREKF